MPKLDEFECGGTECRNAQKISKRPKNMFGSNTPNASCIDGCRGVDS